MRKVLPFFFIAFFSLSAKGQTSDWRWAKRAGGADNDKAFDVANDSSGNVLVTGAFTSSSITFGPFTLIKAGPDENFFVVKYDPDGNVLWAKTAAGNGNDAGTGISTDRWGNVLVTGYFASTAITFGSVTLTNADSTGNHYDIFAVKYDASGNVLWAKSAGGTDHDYGSGISTDLAGNVFVNGFFRSTSVVFGSLTLINAGADDIFMVKYDASGNVLWAKSAGGTNNDHGTSIATDASGNVLVAGYFDSPSIAFNSFTLTKGAGTDIFTVKYDASGNVLWAKSAGGADWSFAIGISTDANGNALATGTFSQSPITFGSITLPNAGSDDIFVVKYDTGGNLLWVKSAGGIYNDRGYGISADENGNVLVAGYFESPSIVFGPVTLTNSFSGYENIFVVKYSPAGNVLWARAAGGTNSDTGLGLSIDTAGNVCITGYFTSPSLTFGSTTLTNASVISEDVFIAKLSSTVGVEEYRGSAGINIFPNPFSVYTTLRSDKIFKDAILTVYNLYGQLVKQIKNISGQTIIFHRNNLPSGLYLIHITQDNKMISADKLVITDK